MQYLEQQVVEFKAEFAKRRKRQFLVTIPLVLVVLLLGVSKNKPEVLSFFDLPSSVVIGILFGIVLAIVVFTLSNWRCPACNRYLGKGIGPAFCPKCGVPLQ